jgi:hypothetical protein
VRTTSFWNNPHQVNLKELESIVIYKVFCNKETLGTKLDSQIGYD